uniref:Uncharacterized protein n=1 Tax=Arundo donax TaxID=35708 RepID=A0A0A8YR30_ARUDO
MHIVTYLAYLLSDLHAKKHGLDYTNSDFNAYSLLWIIYVMSVKFVFSMIHSIFIPSFRGILLNKLDVNFIFLQC